MFYFTIDYGEEEPVGHSGVCLLVSPSHVDRVYGSLRGCGVSHPYRYFGPDLWSEARDVLPEDGECQAAGEWSLFILAGRGYGFDAGSHWPKE